MNALLTAFKTVGRALCAIGRALSLTGEVVHGLAEQRTRANPERGSQSHQADRPWHYPLPNIWGDANGFNEWLRNYEHGHPAYQPYLELAYRRERMSNERLLSRRRYAAHTLAPVA